MDNNNGTHIEAGQTASFSKTVSEYDIYAFAGITGDFNEAHVNEVHAKTTPFKTRIAHGLLSAGLISTVIGTKLPGQGTIYLEQTLKFVLPVYIGDTITATVIVESIDARNRVTLETICTNQRGQQVIVGKALVIAP